MNESQKPLVDINRASLIELTTLRGIGPGLARRIIDHRPYEKIDDLMLVPGIKEAKLLEIKPFICLKEKESKPAPEKTGAKSQKRTDSQATKLGETETFVFLEDRNERQDALLILFGGFILGLIILMLRRTKR